MVADVEQTLDATQIREVVNRVAGGRAKRRRLTQAQCDDPLLPVTGGPPVPWAASQLLLGLRSAGAGAVAAPRCGECGRSLSYMISRKGHLICSPCRDMHQACAKCGNERRVVTRDRHGRPRCGECPDLDGDPMRLLAELLAGIDPALGVQEVLAAAALLTLAAEIPAAILARLLGLHVSVAVAWQRASARDWMTYAADVSRRTPRTDTV